MNNCEYVIENISAFLDNELNSEEKRIFLEHLEECESCKKEFLLIEQLIKSINDIEEVEFPENFHNELMERLKNKSEKIVATENKNEEKVIFLPADTKHIEKRKTKKKIKNKINFRKYIPAFGAIAAVFIFMFLIRSVDLVNRKSDGDMFYDINNDIQINNYSEPSEEAGQELEVSDRMASDRSIASSESVITFNEKKSSKNEIKNYDININVEDFEEALRVLEGLSGYSSSSFMNNDGSSVNREISVEQIVDGNKVDETLTSLESLGKVTDFSKSTSKLTFEMLNIQGKIDANDIEITNLKELYKNNKSLDAMTYIEEKLYEIYHMQNSLKGELDVYKEDVETAKIYIRITEDRDPIVVTKVRTFGQELKDTFKVSLQSTILSAANLVLVITTIWLPLAIVAIVVITIKAVKHFKGGKKNEKI